MTKTRESKTSKKSLSPPADNFDDGGASEFLEDDPVPNLPHLSFIVAPADTTDPDWRMTAEELAKL